MSDYGRGRGSEPWDPEDPLFGDVYDRGRQGHPQQPGWQDDPYAAGGQYGHQGYGYPQQGYDQQAYPQQGYDAGQGYDGQQYGQPGPQQGYAQQYPQQHQPAQHQPAQHQVPRQQYPGQGYAQPGYDGYDGYDTGSYATGPYDGSYDTGSYDTGSYGTGTYPAQHGSAAGGPGPAGGAGAFHDPYGGAGHQDPYGVQSDFYGQGGYPQQHQNPQVPQHPQDQQALEHPQGPRNLQGQQQPFPGAGRPGGAPGPGPGRGPGGLDGRPQEPGTRTGRPAADGADWDGDWDPDKDDPTDHAFFSDRDDEDDEDDDRGTRADDLAGRGRRSGSTGAKEDRKRRGGCACLVALVVLAGAVGGVGYAGYHVYESRFGPAPDYSGQGSGDVQVTVPKGSTLVAIGNLLKDADVVKSVGAFTAAAGKNPKSQYIQAGVYVLHKQMSGASAVAMMLDPTSQNALIIPEGWRDKQIYAVIDQRLGLKSGTTEKTAHDQAKHLGLPDWADKGPHIMDPLEGFLFPAKYSISKGEKPEDLLKQMVAEATSQYAQFDMAAEAKKQGLSSPLQLLTVASLVQAEGKTDDDYKKMAKVVYNRMNPSNQETHGLLQFDSTYNYIKNTSQTKISTQEIQSLNNPYNTYKYKGLPPGPIGNPGLDALKAATEPDSGDWWYFISLDGKTTQFTKTLAEFNNLKAKQD